MNYVVELSDDDGKSCRIALSIPIFSYTQIDTTNSTWRVLDEGYIKYRSGGCLAFGLNFMARDLRLQRGTRQYGIELLDFIHVSYWTVNESGEGIIFQPWCLSFKPVHLTWAVIEG